MRLDDLLPQTAPIGGADIAATAGEGGERQHAIDDGARRFDIDGWVEEIGSRATRLSVSPASKIGHMQANR